MDETSERKGQTDAQREFTVAQRQEAMNYGRASVALEGLKASVEGEAIQQRWLRGEISMDECIAELRENHKRRTAG